MLSETNATHLERYAAIMDCVEVNTSFHRPHQQKAWLKWAEATPPGFKFAVKAPKAMTHTARLLDCGEALAQFFEQIAGLGEKLGPVLLQLAPSHILDPGIARDFLGTLREIHHGPVALEPRNATWFTLEADQLLREFQIARVAADPAKGSALAAKPAGDKTLRYYRLHGSPRTYWSAYDPAQIHALAEEVSKHETGESWIIFDNTAAGEAFKNAVDLKAMLRL